MTGSRALVSVLEDLIALDLDAIFAYERAIHRLRHDETARRELAAMKGDHERHVRELAPFVRELGGRPPEKGDARRFLTQGKVLLGAVRGDSGVLEAMRSNEDVTNQAYEDALAEHGVSGPLGDVLERGFKDERRHRAWLETRIRTLRNAA